MGTKVGFAKPVSLPSPARSPLGMDAPDLSYVRVKLDDAHDNHKLHFSGNLLWAYAASDINAIAYIKYNDQRNPAIPWKLGSSIAGIEFNALYLTNDAQAGKWIDFFYILETEQIRVNNPGTTFANVAISKPAGYDTVADVSLASGVAGTILAADSTRWVAKVTNLSPSFSIRVGDANVGASRGTLVQPLETIEIESTDVIQGYQASGAPVLVGVSYTTD